MNEIPSAENKPARDQEIDVLKGLLTISMILSHTISTLGNAGSDPALANFNTLLQLQTFAGFAFVFGFTTQLSYFSREQFEWRKIARSILRIVGAFYISAIAAAIFYEKKASIDRVFSILIFNHIPLLSEFIMAFALFLVAAALLQRPISWLLRHPPYFGLVNVVLLGCTFLPVEQVKSTYLGLLIGTTQFSAYPIVQYFPLFLLGAFFAYRQVRAHRLATLVCLAGMLLVELLLSVWGSPQRFPPALGWILGSVPFVLFWYYLSRYSARISSVCAWLAAIGANSLFFLVISNLFFLTGPALLGQGFTLKYVLLGAAAVIAACYFLMTIVRVPRRG